MKIFPLILIFVFSLHSLAEELGSLTLESLPNARFHFQGIVGDRVNRNVDEWLLRAPSSNPGMLEMFRARDRIPAPQLVPWAGEFVGKYLISAVQALRMSDDPKLREEVERVVRELIATQAKDGYLGPFPKKDRLRGNWDLWGHYHCIEALLLWHEFAGDREALDCAKRAADLICDTFLSGKMRVIDAGSPEMNMAVIHALGNLYRVTAEARYLAMMREIEKDWERAGDYLRAGVKGTDFYRTPSPRWESLHDIQGLLELYRITGEKKYRDAFENIWRSIARTDIHNTGAFSSGEQATGNPYAPGAIETCCTVAWMALSIDMLRLGGDPDVAEYLELALFNGGLGAQHPSGRWWTYNTPMDGAREASAHTIVFQARAGTPELNCCSVNGPRALGCISEWAVMEQKDSIVINTYIPGKYIIGKTIAFEISGEYPLDASAKIKIERIPKQMQLRLRNPKWSKASLLDGRPMSAGYTEVKARPNQLIRLEFDRALRAVEGQREMARKVSIYRGPVLLAYDQSLNAFDENKLPRIDLSRLNEASVHTPQKRDILAHWIEVTLPTAGAPIRLCDFATAGARGVRYRSWLPFGPPPALNPNSLLISIADPIELNGSEMKTFPITEFPEEDYSVSVRVNVQDLPVGRLAQIFSGWTAGGDDPLRIVFDKGRLFARIENPGGGSSTDGFTVSTNEWHHIAAVKSGNRLSLFVDGQMRGQTSAPMPLLTESRSVVLGGNPKYSGNEFLRAKFSDFKFYARALEESEIKQLAR